jgi:VanZ family protein
LASDTNALRKNATLFKELAACDRMGWRDFPWLDRSDVGRAHVAIHCSIFALAETGISAETLASIHFIVRKCTHVGEYAILALLLLRAATLMTNSKRSIPILYLSVLGVCLIVAATDEFHQTFVASRGASVQDIMIDSSGAVLGLVIASIIRMSRSIRLEKTPADP